MKLLRYILFALYLPALSVSAQTLAGGQVRVDNPSIVMSENGQVMVGMDITIPADVKISANRVVSLTPVIRTENNTHNKMLPGIWVYGRTRSIVQQREHSLPEDAYLLLPRIHNQSQHVNYSSRIPYEPWMEGAMIELVGEVHGCANCLKEESTSQIAFVHFERYQVQPVVAFVSPQVEEIKIRKEEGRAYLDFPVNQTKIYPGYRRNPEELAAIKKTIDVVKNDADTRITEMDITGYASPEGRYPANARLAQGRAEALQKYIMDEYGFPASIFRVNSIPEDWEGLRNYIEQSELAKKHELLSIIDKNEKDFDVKENRLKMVLGKDYAGLLADCYPALRHSDYVVRYVVRSFNVEEAKRIIQTRPQRLSLQEMFMVAQTYEIGSNEFNNVFDVAVRMFPDDETANMNAAAIELKRGNLDLATRYLKRSNPNSAATLNNEGVLKLLQDDLEAAESYFKKAQLMGSEEAEANLAEVDKKRQDKALFGDNKKDK